MGFLDKLFGSGGSPYRPQFVDPDAPPLVDGQPPRYAYTLKVAGVSYRQDAIEAHVRPGSNLRFERDRNNVHDSDAVKVLCDGVHIGFVPKARARMAAEWLDGGRRLVGRVVDNSEWEDDRGRALLGVEMWMGYYE